MANDTAQPGKPTVIYSPLRLNWKNVVAGTVIALLIVAIGVFAFSYYNPDATPVPPVVIKSGTKSAKVATKSSEKAFQKDETADWKTHTSSIGGYSIKYPQNFKSIPSSEQPGLVTFQSSNYNQISTESCLPKVVTKGGYLQASLVGSDQTLNKLTGVYFEKQKTSFKNVIKTMTNLGGQEAIRISYFGPSTASDCLSSDETIERIVAVNSNDGYLVSMRYNNNDKETVIQIFDIMLSTFKFLN